jgi:glycine/D-amino acid oxidase-like deaminating enzyme
MQLSSGAPFWLVLNALDEQPTDAPVDCDVAIVGAGITGALLADSFTAAGFSVTIVDRRQPAEGSTAACTGLLQYELDVELAALAEKIGEPAAARAYCGAAAGITMIEALVNTLPETCGFQRVPSLYLASRRRHFDRIQAESAMRNKHGLDSVVLAREDVDEQYGFASYGAIRTSVAAVADPVLLTRTVLDRAVKAGALLCPRTTVTNWSSNKSGATIETDRGSFKADWVIFSTGYETPKGIRDDLVNLNSTYAMVTVPAPLEATWSDRALVWETARPYTYMRIAEGNRLLIGGADVGLNDAAWRDRLLPRKTRKLEVRLRALLRAQPPETEFSWAGTFGETKDGLPCIGPHEGMPRALFALGYGGNGIVFSVIASQVLRDMVLHKGHPDAELYALDRASL